MNPWENAASWDVLVVTGKEAPGLCLLEGADQPSKLDKKDGKGQTGATVSYTGDQLSEAKSKHRFYGPEEYEAWKIYRRDVLVRGKSLDVYHPSFEESGIVSGMIGNVTSAVQVEDGVWEAVVSWTQWKKPTKAVSTPKGSDSKQQKFVPAAPASALDEKVSALQKQIQDLGK